MNKLYHFDFFNTMAKIMENIQIIQLKIEQINSHKIFNENKKITSFYY